PSRRCGSARSRWTMASMSVSTLIARASSSGSCYMGRASEALSQRLLQQAGDAGHRDAHPVRPVVELVAQLVDRLLEPEDRQHGPRRRLARGHEGRVDSLQVAGQEGLARALLPALGRGALALQL